VGDLAHIVAVRHVKAARLARDAGIVGPELGPPLALVAPYLHARASPGRQLYVCAPEAALVGVAPGRAEASRGCPFPGALPAQRALLRQGHAPPPRRHGRARPFTAASMAQEIPGLRGHCGGQICARQKSWGCCQAARRGIIGNVPAGVKGRTPRSHRAHRAGTERKRSCRRQRPNA